MRGLQFMVVALALAIPVLAGWMLRDATPGAAVVRLAPRAVKAGNSEPHILGVNIGKARVQHVKLMADARALKVSELMPVPMAFSAGLDTRAVENQKVDTPLSNVADARKIAIFFTGNVIGETDPCG